MSAQHKRPGRAAKEKRKTSAITRGAHTKSSLSQSQLVYSAKDGEKAIMEIPK